jgi:DNA invertase Pin-like site-specific DNA recombinase
MSTLKQEDSPERQRSQVLPYAERLGYRIVEEYVDEGLAGDEVARRPAFQKLLRDAQAGKFTLILCDEKSRFGRFDSIDLGEIVAPLRRKGVVLETVAEGRCDWESCAGRLIDTIRQEGKAEEVHALSRRTLSGMLKKAKNAAYLGGPPRYGYRLEPDPVLGRRLVPDGRKAEVVRLIFAMYDQGHTLGAISEELYRRGQPSPRGKPRWSRNAIRKILRCRKYLGDWTWGVQRTGKKHRQAGGEVVETRRGEPRYGDNPEAEWVVKPDTHEPLIARDLFERVQAKLKGNRGRTTPHLNGGGFLLSKLLVCGHCGSFMLGMTRRGSRQYACGGYMAYGPSHCRRHTIHEGPLVRVLMAKLQQAFLDPAHLQQLRAEVAAAEEVRRSEDNISRLHRRLRDLDRKIRQGTERLLEVSREHLADAEATLTGWKRERDRAQEELRALETFSATEDLERHIAEAEGLLWKLQDALRDEDTPPAAPGVP